jgi:tetratricopeptide (TPR) repeat protein
VYSGAGELGTVEYDDPDYVTRNEHVQAGLTTEGLRWAFTSAYAANWFPLTWASHMLDYELYGDDLGAFHTTSVALHIANTLLLFGLLLRTTGLALRAAIVAALFALHPLHVESVVWLSERKGLVSSFFAFAAMHAYVGYARSPSPARMLGVAVCFACGLASKPMVVTLPFVLLLLDVWPLGRLRAAGLGRLALEKWPLFGLTAISIAITLRVQDVAVVGLDSLPVAQRAATAGLAYWQYLWLTIWPVGLTPIHLHPGAGISLSLGAAGLLGVLGLTAGALGGLRSRPALAIGWLWFAGMLVPVIGIVQVGFAIVAERYTYLPLVGLFIAVVWGFGELLERRVVWQRQLRVLAGAVVLLALAGCAVASYARVPDWRDTVSLFGRAVELDPANHRAHYILGLGYARARDDDLAIEHYGRAAALHPANHAALYRIARRLQRKGDLERARRALELELEIAPRYAPARNQLALVWLARGDYGKARAELEQLLEIDPNYSIGHENLGHLELRERADVGAARERFERAIELAPERLSARLALAPLLLAAGEREAAIRQLETARALDPSNEAVLQALRKLSGDGAR